MTLKVAVDAMGGDYAPREIVRGAVDAVRQSGAEVILVGRKDAIVKELADYNAADAPVEIVHCEEVIGMGDHPATAVRSKRDSSIVVATKLVKEGRAVAVVSAGSTGAQMAAALFYLGRIRGVKRPALGIPMPTVDGVSLVLDGGANVDCEPDNLVQFAAMGAVYAEHVLGIAKPRVGLLNIGEEETKGNQLSVAAHGKLKNSGLNFVGNVEGKDINFGKADVIVCDGFVGNVVLKTCEGLASALFSLIKREVKSSFLSKIGGLLVMPRLRGIKNRLDFAEYGGTPLLGVDGVSIICHGRSNARAIRNAVLVGTRAARQGVVEAIRARLHGTGGEGAQDDA